MAELFSTERLIVRKFTPDDHDDLAEILTDVEVTYFEPYETFTREACVQEPINFSNSDEFYAVELKDSKKVIGNIYLGKRDFNSRELGYVLNENYHRQGYITEGCIAVIEYMFKAGVHRIYAECAPQNTPSWKVMEKVGMEREAHFRKNVSFHNDANGEPIYWDTYVYAILNNM